MNKSEKFALILQTALQRGQLEKDLTLTDLLKEITDQLKKVI
ncbi:hypothetical protein ACOSZF_12485 [Cytobacillus firmus]